LNTVPYLIETYDKPDHQSLRQRIRPVHLQYLEMNKDKLLACGAKLDDAGDDASGAFIFWMPRVGAMLEIRRPLRCA
jgi:uncharacterized protein YciI